MRPSHRCARLPTAAPLGAGKGVTGSRFRAEELLQREGRGSRDRLVQIGGRPRARLQLRLVKIELVTVKRHCPIRARGVDALHVRVLLGVQRDQRRSFWSLGSAGPEVRRVRAILRRGLQQRPEHPFVRLCVTGLRLLQQNAGKGEWTAAMLQKVQKTRLIERAQIVRGEEARGFPSVVIEPGPPCVTKERVFTKGSGPDVLVAIQEDQARPGLLRGLGKGADHHRRRSRGIRRRRIATLVKEHRAQPFHESGAGDSFIGKEARAARWNPGYQRAGAARREAPPTSAPAPAR